MKKKKSIQTTASFFICFFFFFAKSSKVDRCRTRSGYGSSTNYRWNFFERAQKGVHRGFSPASTRGHFRPVPACGISIVPGAGAYSSGLYRCLCPRRTLQSREALSIGIYRGFFLSDIKGQIQARGASWNAKSSQRSRESCSAVFFISTASRRFSRGFPVRVSAIATLLYRSSAPNLLVLSIIIRLVLRFLIGLTNISVPKRNTLFF